MKLPPRLLSLCLAATCCFVTSCVAVPTKVYETDSYVLSIEGDTVSMKCESPMPIGEFLKMAQTVTNRMYTFRKDEAVGEVSWLGNMTCERAEFGEFVRTMLYTKGLAVQSRQQGGMEILEVRAIKRG